MKVVFRQKRPYKRLFRTGLSYIAYNGTNNVVWYLIFKCLQVSFCAQETFALPTKQPNEELCMMAGRLVLELRQWQGKLSIRCELRDK
jgi:hypothetical protein